ncbi:Retrovirus-related Pol polyprotein from transposon 297, partial [Araneus ventricosus]
MEKTVNRRLVYYLEHNKILSPFQSGFRPGRCTIYNLLALETDIRTTFLKRQHLVAIFFDIEKAYDRTWRDQTILQITILSTDSLSVLQALSSLYRQSHPLAFSILDLHDRLVCTGFSILLCWVPSHVGISDNEIAEKVRNLLRNYKPNKTKIDVKMNIRLTSDIPINSSPRRFPIIEKEIINEQIEQWLKDKIIRPSTSEYSSPVGLVKKKDGSSRLCIDYRRLNKITVREHFPLPLMDDLLDRLQSANIFTTLDLRNAFFHVDIDPSSKKYASFVTDTGQYEFNKMSFGLTNSPNVFQRYIYNVFRDLIKENVVMIYLDDLVISSENETQGIERLQRVLQTASVYGLELNIKKCQFLKREIEFLGHRIKDGKLYASPLKIKTVMNFPEPKCTKDIRSYLGLTGYFRKFIPHYSAIAKPLSDLLKKDSNFSFGLKERESFNELNTGSLLKICLCLFNPKSETEIHNDASIDGFGACLLQKSIVDNHLHPVYYTSRKTSDTERKYSSYELEVMAVIEALKKFRPYVLGIPFKIVTDCIAFKQTMS